MQSEPKVGVAQIVGKLKGQQIDPLQRDWKGGEAGCCGCCGWTWGWRWKRERGEGGTALSVPNTITHLLHSPHLIDNANLINICNL